MNKKIEGKINECRQQEMERCLLVLVWGQRVLWELWNTRSFKVSCRGWSVRIEGIWDKMRTNTSVFVGSYGPHVCHLVYMCSRWSVYMLVPLRPGFSAYCVGLEAHRVSLHFSQFDALDTSTLTVTRSNEHMSDMRRTEDLFDFRKGIGGSCLKPTWNSQVSRLFEKWNWNILKEWIWW